VKNIFNSFNSKEFNLKVWDVRLKVVPPENRPDPNKLAPEVLNLYNLLVKKGYGDFIAATKTGENILISGNLKHLSASEGTEDTIDTPFKAYNSFAADMLNMFNSPHKEGVIRALKNKYSEELVIISPPKEMEYRSSLSFSL